MTFKFSKLIILAYLILEALSKSVETILKPLERAIGFDNRFKWYKRFYRTQSNGA